MSLIRSSWLRCSSISSLCYPSTLRLGIPSIFCASRSFSTSSSSSSSATTTTINTSTTSSPLHQPTYHHTNNTSSTTTDPLRHITTLASLNETDIYTILRGAADIKSFPSKYSGRMKNETLIMLFEKPSLRTRLSFEVGMTQLSGHAIYYPLDANAPLGVKESIEDTAKVISRYGNIIMARIKSRKTIADLAKYSTIPVINALDDWGHPCQLLADYQTMIEHIPSTSSTPLRGLHIAYIGDLANNVTYDVIRGAAILGQHLTLAGPKGEQYQVDPEVLAEFDRLSSTSGATLNIYHSALDAAHNADIVMTDSWMSYGIDKNQENIRKQLFMPFQVNDQVMKVANKNAKFMHCLPALRGSEVSASVIDGPQSIVFDEAENRLHVQKALMLWLLNRL